MYLRHCIAPIALLGFSMLSAHADELLLSDDFERSESIESKEEIGNGWSTNSRTRAKGNKQADLADGALHIYRHEVADHGVSVVHDLSFKDAVIKMRFRIGKGDEFGVNIADMNEKSVHAGHICAARIRLNKLTIQDLKTGRMKLEIRNRNKEKKLTAADKKLISGKEKAFPIDLKEDEWNQLEITIQGNAMRVKINGESVGNFESKGIGHASKSRIRLAVAKDAWVDDVSVTRTES